MGTVANTEISVGGTPASAPQLAAVIPLDLVRSRLATMWGIGSLLVVTIVVLQSSLGRFGDKTQDAWGWLLPTIMPTLIMIITVLSYTALDPVLSSSVVRRTFFRITMVLSSAYLGLVALTVLIGPFRGHDGAEMVSLMQTSNLWLGPFQGLVASSLGVLFVTTQKKDGEPAT
jgi:hypothetical protein